MSDRYHQHTFPNGLTLLAEPMPGMHSAAMTLLLPAGVSTDPAGQVGVSTVLSDLVLRGAGKLDSRQLTDHLDFMGLQRSSSVGTYHTRFGVSAVGAKLLEALPTYADIILRPHLPEDGFDAAKDLSLQAIQGIDDDPRQKLLIKLREVYFPEPLGRNNMGEAGDLEALTLEQAKASHHRTYNSRGAILSIAGNISFADYKAAIGALFADLKPGPDAPLTLRPTNKSYLFEPQQSEQTHIGLAYPAIPETHEDYYIVRLAIEVLSGGMSGRLFTEVREKRGLCYSVWAGYSSVKESGTIMGYAGTSNERAQATLDCMMAEIHRLAEGITAPELSRAKIGMKSSLIMSGESTGSRAAALAHDFFTRGRLRSLEEIKAAIESVTLEQVNAFLARHKPGPFTTVIVGPKELKLPSV